MRAFRKKKKKKYNCLNSLKLLSGQFDIFCIETFDSE